MVWLSEISPWTLAAFGLGWLVLSGVFALVLGKVLARTNDAAAREERAIEHAEAAVAFRPAAQQHHEGTEDWLSQPALEGEDEYAGRAASGTHFKPVTDEQVGSAGNVRSIPARPLS